MNGESKSFKNDENFVKMLCELGYFLLQSKTRIV